jgi:hypothetical protein
VIVVEIEVGGQRFENIENAFKQLGDKLDTVLDQAPPLLNRSLGDALQQVATQLSKMHGNPWSGGVASDSPYLQVRSGEGLRSIKESIATKIANGEEIVSGQISAGDMAIHETGGVIRPTRSEYLTIPLPEAMDARGIPLRPRAGDWDNTFIKRSKAGNLLIFRRTPASRNITPLYLLKTEVVIPPRLHLEDTIVGTGLPYFENRALEDISALLERV